MQRLTRNPATCPNQAFVDRRLAAILAADVVGFSRMIGTDEVGMLRSLRTLHSELVKPFIEGQGGRIFKLMGDGMLAEFPSAVWALHAAIEIQTSLKERNADFPADGRLEMRMAVHQGDVVLDRGDLLGTTVNIAARLESLAEPGGICISARVYEDAVGNIALDAEDMGERKLKNVGCPVRVYRLNPDRLGSPAANAQRQPRPKRGASTVSATWGNAVPWDEELKA